jgi:hypothetical protein
MGYRIEKSQRLYNKLWMESEEFVAGNKVGEVIENRKRAFSRLEEQGIRFQQVALVRSCLRPKDQRRKRGPKLAVMVCRRGVNVVHQTGIYLFVPLHLPGAVTLFGIEYCVVTNSRN